MTILFNPGFVAIDGNGTPYAGAKLYFYITGTTTPSDTYSESDLDSSHANTNPVVADANGLFGPIYLPPTVTFKAVLKTSADVTIWTRDPINGPSGIPVVQTFTASGTYTPTLGMYRAIIECWGGGGGGGGAVAAATAGQGACGGGGGAGSYSRAYVAKSAVGTSKPVTIGAGGTGGSAGNNSGNAGGDTSVGSLCVGKGGSGGAGNSGSSAANSAGGAGGVAGTGDVTGVGESGEGAVTYTYFAFARGGSTPVGGGGAAAPNGVTSSNGGAGTGYGSGGGGGMAPNGSTNAAGGNGAAGLVVITEFIG